MGGIRTVYCHDGEVEFSSVLTENIPFFSRPGRLEVSYSRTRVQKLLLALRGDCESMILDKEDEKFLMELSPQWRDLALLYHRPTLRRSYSDTELGKSAEEEKERYSRCTSSDDSGDESFEEYDDDRSGAWRGMMYYLGKRAVE